MESCVSIIASFYVQKVTDYNIVEFDPEKVQYKFKKEL